MGKFLFLLIVLAGCSDQTAKPEVSFLALGDSYTIGEAVDEEGRWPNQLASRIKASNIKVQIVATTGWTTTELAEGIVQANITEKFDLVSLLIGVNNQYRGLSIQDFEIELRELFETTISFSKSGSSNVLILSIPDWSAFPFAEGRDINKISKEIDAFNAVVKKMSDEFNFLFINVTDISRRAASNESLVAEDSLHPSKKMYRLWVDKIMESEEFQKIDL
jgi:lysophospholipase L1-like esterase